MMTSSKKGVQQKHKGTVPETQGDGSVVRILQI